MKKYIDAEGVMRACYDSYLKTGNRAYYEIANLVDAVPAAEVQEIRRGSWLPDKWIADREDVLRLVLKCSLCGGQVDGLVDYCPHCGAIMSEEEDE